MKLRSERIKPQKQIVPKQEPRVEDQSSGSSSSSSSSSQSSRPNSKRKQTKKKQQRKTDSRKSLDHKKSQSVKSKKIKQEKVDVKSQQKVKSKTVKKQIQKDNIRQSKQIKVQSKSETPDRKKQKEIQKSKIKKNVGKNKNDLQTSKNNENQPNIQIIEKDNDRPYDMEDLSSDEQPQILQNRRQKQQRQISNPNQQEGLSKVQLRQSINDNNDRNNDEEQSLQFEEKIYESCVNFSIQIQPVYPLRILSNAPILLSLSFQYKDYEDGKWKFRRICPSMLNLQNTGITQFPSEHYIEIINQQNGNKMIERKKIMELNLKGINMSRLQREVDRSNENIKNPKSEQADLNYWGIANKYMIEIIARLIDDSQKQLRSEIDKIIQDSGIDCHFQSKTFYSKGLSQELKGMLVTQSQEQQQKLRKENLMRIQLHFKQYRKIQDCGSSSFKTLRQNGYFVDKSLLIRDIILDPSKYILISKPHRWGKTVNLDMLQVFFDGSGDRYKQYENRKIFQGNLKLIKQPKKLGAESELNIINARINGRSVVEQYQGKYIAIKITIEPIQTTAYETFKSIMAQTYRKFIPFQQEQQEIKSNTISSHSFAQSVAARNCQQFQKILNKQGTEQETIDSLRRLVNIMVEHYNRKVILLIDEINQFSHLQNKEKHQELMNFLYNMLTVKVLSDPSLSDNIFKLLIMGQTPLTFKSLGLLKICEPDENRYNHYFGFSDSQMSHIAKRYLKTVGNDLIFYQTMLLRYWYGGFPIDNDNENRLYNPASIISALALQQIKPYCATKQNICIIEQCLNRSTKCKQMLLQLLCNDRCKISDRELNLQKICLSSRIIQQYGKSLLYNYGFVVKDCKINRNYFRIPNAQIRTFLQWKLQAMYSENFQKNLSYQRYLDNLSEKSFVMSQIINDLCDNIQRQFNTFESLKLILQNPDTIADIFCMQPTYRAKILPGHLIKILIPTDQINPVIVTAYKQIDNDDGLSDKMSESMWEIYGKQCLESALQYCIQNQIIVDSWIFRVVGLYAPFTKGQSTNKIWKAAVMQHELYHRQVQKASNYMKRISQEMQQREPEIKMIDIVVKEQEDFPQIPRNKKRSALQLKKLYEFLLSEQLSVPQQVDDIQEYGKRRKLE